MLKQNSNSYDKSDLYKEITKDTNNTTIEQIFKMLVNYFKHVNDATILMKREEQFFFHLTTKSDIHGLDDNKLIFQIQKMYKILNNDKFVTNEKPLLRKYIPGINDLYHLLVQVTSTGILSKHTMKYNKTNDLWVIKVYVNSTNNKLRKMFGTMANNYKQSSRNKRSLNNINYLANAVKQMKWDEELIKQ